MVSKVGVKDAAWNLTYVPTKAHCMDCQFVACRAPSQYPKRRLSVGSRKVSKPRDWYFKLSCFGLTGPSSCSAKQDKMTSNCRITLSQQFA